MLTNRTKKFFLMITTVLTIVTAGCAPTMYVPDERALQRMTPREALRIITKAPHDKKNFYQETSAIYLNGVGEVREITVHEKRKLVFVGKNGESVTFLLKDLETELYTRALVDFAGVVYLARVKLNSDILGRFTRDGGQQFVDAIYVLKARAISEDKFDANFEKVARDYRNALTKPEFPEEARKYYVQAEDAVREMKFDDAADLYGETLNIAPWWPEGHFNRALILGEVGDFNNAVIEMKRYLLLVPEAPNARAVQDKIYIWEGKANAQN
jgi:tetratricopeptide (TPR) repeat protein